ncbi:aquaporin [Actinoallomurus iriomotensis]|uniref:Glucose dehydrogenase n=1 Tax=Actinoallomurus iriomotensis TaxID=478107 RepID=A0A9W6RGY1_9ACTN|nr:aquaporin [Actinoallomurus iriomotensis]GLY75374.1 hypothetical protein Airi01_036410 [Actinoallomurus iriomotensis]
MVGWREVAAEFAGTALLLLLAVSAIVAGFAAGSPIVGAVPDEYLRRLMTGVLIAAAAAGIVYSPLGRISGGHLNPAVTTGFWVLGKLTSGSALRYAAAQVAGATTGALVALLVWGHAAVSVRVGATVPRLGGAAAALGAETLMTFLLLTLIFTFVDHPRLMPFTAASTALLVAVLMLAEAPVSGTSLNPARSFGPALVGATWTGLWVYVVAPTLGALAAALLHRHRRGTVACGKLLHDNAYRCRFLNCAYTPPRDRVQRLRRHHYSRREQPKMKAIAVYPGKADSAHLTDVPRPAVTDVPGGHGVLVRVLRVGLDGTDKEINAGEYGTAPAGEDILITGHESLGVVEEVGPAVSEVRPGDLVVARVRRAGGSLYDLIDTPDMTDDEAYFEHGISRVHGFLREYYAEEPRYLIPVPAALRHVAVLLEPTSVAEKGILQAYDIQRRLKVWHPSRAAVLGAGTIGLLATMILRNRGLEVTTFGLEQAPYLNSELVEAIGASYVSTRQTSPAQVAAEGGAFDLVFEATGYSPIVFDAMCGLLAKNGVLILSSVTGGMRRSEVPSDAINLDFVLGNKVMFGTVNASREHFEEGVRDLAVAEARTPGWLSRLLTHPIPGLDRYADALTALGEPGAIKVYVEVSPDNV